MKQIKFSHRYPKLKDCKTAQLLQVIPIELKNLSEWMREYDTADGKGGNYPLPKSGRYLLLIFNGDNGKETHLFTTVRSCYPMHKEGYYKDAVGEWFDILITSAE